jgi:hypothetical protein
MPASRPIPEFQRYQFSFTRHVRDPGRDPRPEGVVAQRMQVYNDLLFKNVFNLVSSCFPVAHTILGEKRWEALVRSFFVQHRCRTPYFRQIPEEFLQFMQEREPNADEPPFLIYLMHYEWVELAVEVSDKEVEATHVDTAGDLRSQRPIMTPAHMLLTYPYAVHRIGEHYQPTEQQQEETNLLVFRDSDDAVRFIVLNPVSARLIYLIGSGTLTGDEAVSTVVAELEHPDPQAATAGGREILEGLRREGAIVGTTDPK